MIKIAQIIDKETKGLGYLKTYKDEIINGILTDGIHVFEAEVIEFDGETPIRFIESRELTIDLDNMNDKTIKELFEETL